MEEQKKEKQIINSYLTIRKIIGILGILLPLIVVAANHFNLLSSISHYYYTRSAVFFIAILSVFGLFLVSYDGYPKVNGERFSDNFITHIGGFAALAVVLFPAKCSGTVGNEICNMYPNSNFPLFGHNCDSIHWIHVAGALTFFLAMGYMSVKKFTKGDPDKEGKKLKNDIFKYSGYIIWGVIGVLVIEIALKLFKIDFQFTDYDIYIAETIAIVAFGVSWLVKGEAIRDSTEAGKKVWKWIKCEF
ncbi:MAG: hypothetical protein ABFR62_13825 [Bacteroidota bacterium]